MFPLPILALAALAFWFHHEKQKEAESTPSPSSSSSAPPASSEHAAAKKTATRLKALSAVSPSTINTLANVVPPATRAPHTVQPAPASQQPQSPAAAAAAALPSVINPAPRSPEKAAKDLKAYLARGGARGSKTAPSSYVRDAQRDMGGLVNDGIMGPKTRARARALGAVIPA